MPDETIATESPLELAQKADAFGVAYEALIAALPAGSRVEFRDGLWHCYRGPGVNSHGSGKTLSRAIQTVNSHTTVVDGKPVLYSESGEVLPPE